MTDSHEFVSEVECSKFQAISIIENPNKMNSFEILELQ